MCVRLCVGGCKNVHATHMSTHKRIEEKERENREGGIELAHACIV